MAVTVIRHISRLVLLALLGLPALAVASPAPAPAAVPSGLAAALAKSGSDDFLQPDQAFRLEALAEGSDRVQLNFGNYLVGCGHVLLFVALLASMIKSWRTIAKSRR